MTDEKGKNLKNKKEDHEVIHVDLAEEFSNQRLTIFLSATGYTVASVAIMSGLGYSIDMQLGTKPAFFITGLVLSFPLTMILIYKKFKKLGQELSKPNK